MSSKSRQKPATKTQHSMMSRRSRVLAVIVALLMVLTLGGYGISVLLQLGH